MRGSCDNLEDGRGTGIEEDGRDVGRGERVGKGWEVVDIMRVSFWQGALVNREVQEEGKGKCTYCDELTSSTHSCGLVPSRRRDHLVVQVSQVPRPCAHQGLKLVLSQQNSILHIVDWVQSQPSWVPGFARILHCSGHACQTTRREVQEGRTDQERSGRRRELECGSHCREQSGAWQVL